MVRVAKTHPLFTYTKINMKSSLNVSGLSNEKTFFKKNHSCGSFLNQGYQY